MVAVYITYRFLFPRSFRSMWLPAGQLVGPCGPVVHHPGVSTWKLRPAPLSFWLSWISVSAPVHRGLHGRIQPFDGHVHMRPDPGGRPHLRRIWPPWCSVGDRSWLPGHRLGVGFCFWSQCFTADVSGRAVWRECDMRPCLREVTFVRKCSYLCTFLSDFLRSSGLLPTVGGWRIWIFAFLSSLTPATSVIQGSILSGFPSGSYHDEHFVSPYRHWFVHTSVLGVTQGWMWRSVGLCNDQTCGLAHILQRTPLHTSGLSLPLLRPGSPLSRRGGFKINPPASPTPACQP